MTVGIAVAAAHTFGTILVVRGLFIVPGLVSLATIYSYLSGYGIYLIAIVATAYATIGWYGILAYFAGRIGAFIVAQIIEFKYTQSAHDQTGQALTTAEQHFFNAYRLHASSMGVTTDITVSDEELNESNWSPVLADLVQKWPEVVQRFTTN